MVHGAWCTVRGAWRMVHLPEEHAKVRTLRLEQLARRGELGHLRRERRGHGVGLPLADVEQRKVVLALEEHLHRGLEARRARHLQPHAPRLQPHARRLQPHARRLQLCTIRLQRHVRAGVMAAPASTRRSSP
jgi:hypothetical protein